MCRRHLLGEHVEMHMAAASLARGRSVAGHVERGQLEPHRIVERHDELAAEMLRRGYRHDASKALRDFTYTGPVGRIDETDSLAELARRCECCRARQEAAYV